MKNYDKFNNLVHIHRWAGWRVLVPESDSDHVWGMNALAIEFVSGLPEELRTTALKELIYRIALHDLGETFYVDIPRNFKYSSNELAELIHKTEEKLVRDNLPEDIANDVQNSKSKDLSDPYGFIVSVLDMLQAGMKMKEELQLGNLHFTKEILNPCNTLYNWCKKLKNNKLIIQDFDLTTYLHDYIMDAILYLKS